MCAVVYFFPHASIDQRSLLLYSLYLHDQRSVLFMFPLVFIPSRPAYYSLRSCVCAPGRPFFPPPCSRPVSGFVANVMYLFFFVSCFLLVLYLFLGWCGVACMNAASCVFFVANVPFFAVSCSLLLLYLFLLWCGVAFVNAASCRRLPGICRHQALDGQFKVCFIRMHTDTQTLGYVHTHLMIYLVLRICAS